MKKQTKRKSRKEQLQEEIDKIIPDREEQKAMINGLYQGNPLFGERGIFTDLLQRMGSVLKSVSNDFRTVSYKTSS